MMGYTIQMPCPPRHQIAALFEEIRPAIRCLDLIGQFVRQCLVCNFLREIGLLCNPIREMTERKPWTVTPLMPPSRNNLVMVISLMGFSPSAENTSPVSFDAFIPAPA
jgi:hypothetical protein